MFNRRTLPLVLTCVAVLALAFAVSCRGFFQNPTLTTITINPTAPQVEVGKTLQLEAFGTYDDGSRSQIRSGVSWSIDDPSVATVDTNSGILTGVGQGTATVTASAQALSNTATATVFIVVSSLTVNPNTWSFSAAGGTQSKNFTVTANNNIDVTSGATFTPSNTTIFSCPSGTDPVVCTATNPTAGNYTITVTYPGTNLQPVIDITVSP